MTLFSGATWLGLCPRSPVLHASIPATGNAGGVLHSGQPGSDDGKASHPGRSIRCGIGIAAASIKTLIREKQLLWFSLLAGIVILFLIAAEALIIAVTIANSESSLPFLAGIPVGNSFLVFDARLFILQMVCLSCFNLLLAGLILYRSRGNAEFLTTRDALSAIRPHAGTIAALSTGMTVIGTFAETSIHQTLFFGKIVSGIDMAVFYLPYAYYIPKLLEAALHFSAIIIAITILQFLLALYVVPVIVLEKKKLLPALAGSAALMKRTWRELLGCGLMLGAIVLGVAAIALVIGQSPHLLNHDYDFFLQISRGQVLMTVACYGFYLACGVMTALGSTALGVAIMDLYSCGKNEETRNQQVTGKTVTTEPAR